MKQAVVAVVVVLCLSGVVVGQGSIEIEVRQETRLTFEGVADFYEVDFRPHIPASSYRIEKWRMPYESPLVDESGDPVIDEGGFELTETKYKDMTTIVVAGDVPPGIYQVDVVATTIRWAQQSFVRERGSVGFEIEGATPAPDPDDGDDGEPDDGDDDEDPEPSDAPFEAPGLTVVIVREASNDGLLPNSQMDILSSSRLLGYLATNCAKDESGDPLFASLDDDYGDGNFGNDYPSVLKQAYFTIVARSGEDEPWIGISNGQTGTIQELPMTVNETLSLIQKYELQ